MADGEIPAAPGGGYSELITELGRAQKPGHGVPPYTRYVNRWLGRRLAAVAYMLGLTPNAVTWISLAVSVAGLVILATVGSTITATILVPFLLCLGYALDSADGQLARLQHSGSPAGEWLDHVVDAARAPAVHLATLVYFLRYDDHRPWMLAIPMVFVIVGSARFFSQILGEQLRARHGVASPAQAGDRSTARRAWMQLPSDTGVLSLAFVLIAWPMTFAVVYAILCVANVILAAASWRRRYRELSDVGGPGQP